MSRRPKRPNPHADIDEIAPNRFIIHNPKLRPVLRGEGVTLGHTFELVSERRAGLLARLRIRHFNVRTLSSRFARLPRLPQATPLGEIRWREVTQRERYSAFDGDTLRWRDLNTEERDKRLVVGLALGQIVRRRLSRGSGEYFQVADEAKGALNLLPLSQTEAILRGYAQATMDSDIVVEVVPGESGHLLPLSFVLPSSHLELLKRLGTQTKAGIEIGPLGWPLTVATLHLLNLRPAHDDLEVVQLDEEFHEWADHDDDDDDEM